MGVYDPDEVAQEVVNAGPAEVVRDLPSKAMQEPALNPQADSATWTKLCDRLDAAETVSAINSVVAASTRAHKAGAITDGQLATMKTAVGRKRELLSAPPPPPKSNPVQPADLVDEDVETDDYAASMHDGGES
jgi:hypothetical protein